MSITVINVYFCLVIIPRRNSGPVLHCTLGADKSGSQYCKMFSTQKSVLKTEIDYFDLTNFSNLPICRSMGLQGN